MKFLQEDTFLTGFLSRLIDILLMSVLWLLTSIPVITIGASTTALYDVSLHLVLDDRSGIVLNFLRSMKRNFGRATLVWLLFIASGLFLGTDLWAAFHWDTPFRIVPVFLILAACWFWMAAYTHTFAGLAWFDGKPLDVLKKSFMLAMKNGIFTMFIILLNIIPLIFLARRFTSDSFGQWPIFYLLIGKGAVAYLSALHLARLFAPEEWKEKMKDMDT